MSKSGFFIGLGVSLLFGITFSFYNLVVATILSVAIGAFFGESKKAGFGIGFLIAPIIILSPTLIPLLFMYYSGTIDVLFLVVSILGIIFNMYTTILWVVSIIVGIIVGHYTPQILERVRGEGGSLKEVGISEDIAE